MLDITIDQWNGQLKRAQPHRNGRVLICFGHTTPVLINGIAAYDVEPIVGKMILMKSGTWRFFKLTKKDVYKSLVDLRVGRELDSDPVVIRLLNGIEGMLKQRLYLVTLLTDLSRSIPGKLSAIQASCCRNADYAVDLSQRIKLDWTLGADLAERTITSNRRERYAREKLKKMAARVDVDPSQLPVTA